LEVEVRVEGGEAGPECGSACVAAEVVTDRTPFELLARTENELEELAHDWVFGGYRSKQRIVLSVTRNSRTAKPLAGPNP